MPYRGDYSFGYGRGSRGDPGFLGNLFRAATRTIGGAVGGFFSGGPIAAIAGALGGATSATRANIAAETGPDVGPPLDVRAMHMAAIHAHQQHVLSSTRAIGGNVVGTPHGRMSLAAAGAGGAGGGGGGTAGYHLDKKTKSYLVRNRSMNPYNPRALHRAERRVRKFVHMASHLIRWVHPGKTGRAVPRFGKRRKK